MRAARHPPRGEMHLRQPQPALGSAGGSGRPGLGVCLLAAGLALVAAPEAAHASRGTRESTLELGEPAPRSRDQDKEFQVKAAAIFHFVRYTTWPEESFDSDKAPILVLIVGHTPMRKQLEAALVGKQIGQRKIAVAQIDAPPTQLSAHFVLEGQLAPQQQAQLLELARDKPVFLFGDRPGYARSGAGGNFLLEQGKLQFELNAEVLKAGGLAVSSQLLKLARLVKTEQVDAP